MTMDDVIKEMLGNLMFQQAQLILAVNTLTAQLEEKNGKTGSEGPPTV